MNVCSSCFSDLELKSFIDSVNQKGRCDVCYTEGNILSLEELQDFFQELLSNFELDEDGIELRSLVQSHWSFFSNHTSAAVILNDVIPALSTVIQNADTRVRFTIEIRDNIGYWQQLKDDLKWSQRYISNISYLVDDLGWDGFFNSQFKIDNESLFYRARIHHESGKPCYGKHEMGCPQPIYASGGRANPLGIPFLYLSDNEETVLYEVRASYLDEVSVGAFKVNRNNKSSLTIVDFTENPSLYQPTKVNDIIKSYLLKKAISRDLSKPMRRYDSEIEYIPTQFICEFIKVITGADGIQFRSSLHSKGKNLVMFDQNSMECVDVSLLKITSLTLKSTNL